MNNKPTLYNETVMDHFMNPINMGEMKDPDGVGEVGAAACFEGNTLVATADGTLNKPIKDFIGKIIPVWSFNIHTKLFEIKNATGVKSGIKKVYKIKLSDSGSIVCTDDHKFLVRPSYEYIENKKLDNNDSIFPFKRKIIKNGYWEIRRSSYRKEHIEIFKIYNKNYETKMGDIHHINFNKRDNIIENLQFLTKTNHTKLHSPSFDNPILLEIKISKDEILKVINNFDDKSEMANLFELYTDELMYHFGYYNIDKRFKKLSGEEQRKLISKRQQGKNNSYYKMSTESRYKFASHPKEKNCKWMGYTNEDLFKIGNELYKTCGKLTNKLWIENAKKNKIPQSLSTRFSSWNCFVDGCKNYNHNIIFKEYIGEVETYTLQVEENNNYVVLSRISKNVEEGIVVKNCGDIMKVSIKVKNGKIEDALFKVFGCASAISSADMAMKLIKGKTIEEAQNITNEDVMNELGGVEYWKKNLPQKIHCSLLAESAIESALEDYLKRHPDIAKTINDAAEKGTHPIEGLH